MCCAADVHLRATAATTAGPRDLGNEFEYDLSEEPEQVKGNASDVPELSTATSCWGPALPIDVLEPGAPADQLLSRAPEDVVGIVIDRRGSTEDFDWHAFMCDPSAVPQVPDRLVVRREAIDGRLVDRGAWSMGDPTPAFATLADVDG